MLRAFKFSSTALLIIFLIVGCDSNPLRPNPNRGDVNLNGIPFEIADAVLFSNYFLYGPKVFSIDESEQSAATDVNVDGRILSVADLVYLTLILNDNEPKWPKVNPVRVRYEITSSGRIKVLDAVQIGAAYVVIEGNNEPVLLATNMKLEYAYDGTNTRALVWLIDGFSFTGEFLSVSNDVASLEMATIEARPVILDKEEHELFFLNQNYPNPFSSKTAIGIVLAKSSQISLVITDAAGRVVFTHKQTCEAGVTEIIWLGNNNAGELLDSGVYYCSVTALGVTKKIKMNLIR